MTTANKLTLLRIIMIPVFIVVMLLDFPYHNIVSLVIFAIASITDTVDGYIARKYNQVTDFGKFMDPLADKLLVFAAIIIFVEWGIMPSWAAFIILMREFAVTGLRLVAVGEGKVIAAGMSGKIKTASTMVGICIMLFGVPEWLNWVCIGVMLATTVYSGVEYFVKNGSIILRSM